MISQEIGVVKTPNVDSVAETPNSAVMSVDKTPNYDDLLPAPLVQGDLFICDVADAVIKDIDAEIEHPFFALSKKPPTTVLEYRNGDKWLRITPSAVGQATIYDKDILVYAISQLMAKLNRGEKVTRRIRLNSRECLQFIKRGTAGKDYTALIAALDRLQGMTIRTNIRHDDEEDMPSFSLIDGSNVKRKFGLNGRLIYCDILLSEWVFDAIRDKAVLTLSPDYFEIDTPTAKRIYELARKHCGQKDQQTLYLETLFKKSGASGVRHRNTAYNKYLAAFRTFRLAVREIAEANNLPDYSMIYVDGVTVDEDGNEKPDPQKDKVIFSNRDDMPKCKPAGANEDKSILARLDPDINEKARKIAQGWDMHYVKDCFAAWWAKQGKPDVKNPDALFLTFCKTWQQKRGRP